ncbi:MAG: glycerol-3-phosphate 1-O-acyltransferase PlsY [Chloroflexota bacterium]
MGTVVVACIALLAGSIPFGVVLTWLLLGSDVRRGGSGNIGAANVARVAGTRVGIAVAVLDVVKGMLPVWIGMTIGLPPDNLAIVALAAVLGHDFSLFLQFRGGKGVATSLGVFLVLAPVATLLAALTWLAVLLASRYTSLGSLAALALLPVYVAVTGRAAIYVGLASILFVLAAIKHWENIIRLLTGKESKFRQRTADGG